MNTVLWLRAMLICALHMHDTVGSRRRVLLCQQAGGVARMLDGSDYSANLKEGTLLVASCEDVWHELHEKFAPVLL